MRLDVSDNVDPSKWDSKICLFGGSIFYSNIWAKYTAANFQHAVPQYFSLSSSDGELLGLALGFRSVSSNKLLSLFNKRLWMDATPIICSSSKVTLCEFLRIIERHIRHTGFLELSIGSFASHSDGSELKKLGFDLSPRIEFQLHLDCEEETLWRGLEHKRRKNIMKAKRAGIAIVDLPADRGIDELHRLQSETFQRIAQRGGPRLVVGRPLSNDPLQVLLAGNIGRILGASLNGRIVSAGLFTCFNGMVYYTLSGHSREGLEVQAPTFLVWEAMLRYREQGAILFNLGGVKQDALREGSSEHGVYVYKRGFGGDTVICHSGTKIFHKNWQRIISMGKTILRR